MKTRNVLAAAVILLSFGAVAPAQQDAATNPTTELDVASEDLAVVVTNSDFENHGP